MGRKTSIKTSSKMKRIRYIEVEGIKNEYLDAALLHTCSVDSLTSILSDEHKLLKKAGITTQSLKQNELEYNHIIQAICPYMLESYSFYNSLANSNEKFQEAVLVNLFNDTYKDFSFKDWELSLKKAMAENDLPFYQVINILRFYKNGEFKTLIKFLMEEEEFVLKFYDETEIKIDGYELEWDELLRQKYEGMLGLDDFELPEDARTSEGLTTVSRLQIALKMLEGVAEEIDNFGDQQELEQLLESEREQVGSLKQKNIELIRDLKSKDAQIKSLTKESRNLGKQIDIANQKTDQQQKEVGRLGQVVGEMRKENEELKKNKGNLENRLKMFETEKNSISTKLQKEFEKSSGKLLDQLKLAEQKSLEKDALLKSEKEKNGILTEELLIVKNEFEQTIAILETTESERNELIEQLKHAQVPATVTMTATEDDNDLFDFDADDIGDFIDFDHKPTRN